MAASAVAVAAGAAVLVAAYALPGIDIAGSACAGGGAEQVCRDLARGLSLGRDLGWPLIYPLGAAVIVGLGLAGLVRAANVAVLVAIALLVVSFGGLAYTEAVGAKFCGSARFHETCERTDAEWGPYLRPPLLELRHDALRRYEGKEARPGGPTFNREDILPSFSVEPRTGWTLVRNASVVLYFLSIFELVRRLSRQIVVSLLVASTGGIVVWAQLAERFSPCDPDIGECYGGFATALSVVVAAFVWLCYFVAVAARRSRARRGSRQ